MATVFFATAAMAGTREKVLELSLINLVATPERYHGKQVNVTGYVFIGTENMSLCPYTVQVSSKDCIWINIDSGPYASDADKKRISKKMAVLEKFNGKTATIIARFDKKDHGHFGGWSGALTKIIDVYDHTDESALKSSVWK
ncbi:hypothetical protein DFR42_12913 [Undibacterium pigrum]|uniref:Uncharacterized protein n=2 Tax=Undibacterium pigrum TaxID=401470 RepID=A0A318IKG7_9BURK|nr:hypothetical protein DFR42_12913 [Undibacterium pigrum]